MTFKEFSAALIKTQDLDPDYVFLREILKDEPLHNKIIWAQTKIFIYDTASEYQYLHGKKTLDQVVYGSERRKNKRNTEKQLNYFINGFKIEYLPREYTEARKYLTGYGGIGDWAAWKFCDLLERVCDIHIDFSQVDFRDAYEYPLRGLCRVNGEPDSFVEHLSDTPTYEMFMYMAENELGQIRNWMAPPKMDRPINIQEIETCLCKYHSYLQGHYFIGKDTAHLIKRFKEEGIEVPVDLTKYHLNPLSI